MGTTTVEHIAPKVPADYPPEEAWLRAGDLVAQAMRGHSGARPSVQPLPGDRRLEAEPTSYAEYQDELFRGHDLYQPPSEFDMAAAASDAGRHLRGAAPSIGYDYGYRPPEAMYPDEVVPVAKRKIRKGTSS
jgi:hypothetical protein